MLDSTDLDSLTVFPLPNVVLMPGEALPLHIFEPRYQAMLEHVLATNGLLGMGTLRDETGAIHDEVGVGRVERVLRKDDGRADIVLVHVQTVRVQEECEQVHPFRQFKVRVMHNQPPDPVELSACRSLLYQLAATTSGVRADATSISELEGLELVHSIARRLFQEPSERIVYLRATDAQRVSAVSSQLAALMTLRPSVADA